jgi:hypothetical protein
MTTMMSRAKGFIFIHMPKAAGSSVAAALRPHDDHPFLNRPMIRKIRNRIGLGRVHAPAAGVELFRHHATAVEVRTQIGAEAFGRLFSFGFVRNPWDFYVSAYHYIRKVRFHPRHGGANRQDFRAFVADWLNTGGAPLAPCVCDENGRQLVDFVGRYETLEEDFAMVCARLNVADTLPHVNRSDRSAYKDYYDDATRALVAHVNRRDIEAFDYKF